MLNIYPLRGKRKMELMTVIKDSILCAVLLSLLTMILIVVTE